MAFTITPKDAPAKVEGALNGSSERPKTARERAIEAVMGQSAQTPAEAPRVTPAIDPAAAAASNHPGDNQLSPEAFAAIRAKASQEQANQTPSSEASPATPPVPASEATKTDEGTELSPRYAQLARQEKAIRARAQALKAEQAAVDKAKADLAAREAELTTKYVPKERLSRETLAVLAELGVDYNTLTSQALGEPQDPRDAAIAELKAELAEVKGKMEQTQKSFQDDKTQSYEQAKAQIKYNVAQLVSKDPNFETIKATDSISDVVDLIEQTFQEGLDEDHPKGTLLTVEEASQIVEDYLVVEAEKLARLSKIQKRLAPKEPTPPAPSTKQDSSQQSQRPPSLTNTMTGAPRKEYTARQRAMFAAQHGANWQEKIGEKAS